jgi:hypothetical protein
MFLESWWEDKIFCTDWSFVTAIKHKAIYKFCMPVMEKGSLIAAAYFSKTDLR